MQPTWLRRSFRWRLFAALTFTIVSIEMIGIYRIVQAQGDRLHAIEMEKGTLLASMTARSVATPLLLGHIPEVASILHALKSDRSFVGVELLGADRSVVARVRTENPPEKNERQVFNASIENPNGGLPFGYIRLERSKAFLVAARQDLIRQETIALMMYLLVSGTVLLITTRLVTAPLLRLRSTILRLRDGDYSIATPDVNRRDEIGDVARAIEHLRAESERYQEARRTHDLSARMDRNRILRALESTQDAVLILSATGEVVFLNPQAQDFFPHASKQSAALFSHVLDQNDADTLSAAVYNRESVDLTTELEHSARPDSTADYQDDRLPVLVRINPIHDADSSYLGTVILVADNSTQDQIASRIRRLANHDSLTGLMNRRVLEEELEQRVADQKVGTALLIMDLDRFKSINDTLGHPVGDALLIQVATLLSDIIGRDDLAVRLGGDEFALLLAPGTGRDVAESIANRIVDTLKRPLLVEDRRLQTGASVGITVLDDIANTAQDLVRKADLALYDAKRQGRGRISHFHPEMELRITRKADIEAGLRRGLRDRTLVAFFQQQRSLSDGRLTGFEALARWEDPVLGPVNPGEFVPVAEESDLIKPLTQQILDQTCARAALWWKQGFRGRISVNFSPKLFAQDMSELISDSLLQHNCPAEALAVEITEAVFVEQGTDAREQILRLQAMGLKVALDDFGMGYSSLSYLQRFPVNNIKIDRAFVCRVTESPQTAAIVGAIVELGHALDMTVTAEGVETQEQLLALRACEADCVQGYIDGKPMPAEEADIIVADSLSTDTALRA